MEHPFDFLIYESHIDQHDSLNDLLDNFNSNYESSSLGEYLESLIHKKNLSKIDIFNRTRIGRTYIYQIFSDTRHASRDKVIQIALASECTLKETQSLLLLAKHSPLNSKDKRDLVISYSLLKKMTVAESNILLQESHLKPLFSDNE
ncbi:MAG: helix-turn-helix transcriptional regulator [Clostridiales bacterium]|nr:helix-turn-helix transcriptional regulator [Clostridiales bacterium]